MSRRLFIAVDPPEPVRLACAARLEQLRALAPHARWVRGEALHLTLAFLGATEEARLADVQAAMQEAVAGHPPFALSLEGGGGFGSPKAPRVLWVDVGGEREALAALQASLARALEARGFPLEKRPFRPHLTLARAREPRGDRTLVRSVEALQGFNAGSAEVGALRLYESQLSPQGSRYTLLSEAMLQG